MTSLSPLRLLHLATVSLALLPLTLLVAGCGGGGNAATVTGTVTLDGAPLPNAVVTFSPADGEQNAIGRTDSQGRYELYRRDEAGAVLGEYTVRITGTPDPGSAQSTSAGSDDYLAQVSGTASSSSTTAFKDPVPAKYNTQTELTATVQAGANDIDFDLQSN